MKKAWFNSEDLKIKLITDLEVETFGLCLSCVFDETTIESGYELIAFINGEYFVIEDTARKNSDILNKQIEKEILKMEYGKRVLAYIGVRLNSFTIEQYQTLLQDETLKMIQTLLGQGALESSYMILSSYPSNETLSQSLIDDILLEIDKHIQLVGV